MVSGLRPLPNQEANTMRTSLHVVAALGPLVVSLSLAAGARADVVGPAPTSCPAGSVGDACHGSSYCRPTPCVSDGDCTGGLVCREQGLCLGSVGCVGRLEPDSAPPPPRDSATRTCSAGEACGGASCDVARRCVPAPVTPAFSGCDCRAARPASIDPSGPLGFAGVLAMTAASLLWSRGRRRRAKSRRGALSS